MDIVWLTGHSGAGKTTLGLLLAKEFHGILLDGDEMRESICKEFGFSHEDREGNNLRVAELAKVLSKQTPVFVSVIAPLKETRRKIDDICSPFWVYVKKTVPERENHFYEESNYHFTVENDFNTAEESFKRIRDAI